MTVKHEIRGRRRRLHGYASGSELTFQENETFPEAWEEAEA